LNVTYRLSAEGNADFFAKLFWIKKRVFGYFFQKVTLLIKSILICSWGKISKGNFPFFNKDSIYVELFFSKAQSSLTTAAHNVGGRVGVVSRRSVFVRFYSLPQWGKVSCGARRMGCVPLGGQQA